MQSTHMASQQITEEAVYLCTGNPLPRDVEQISYWLLNESFAESFKRIQQYVLHIMPLFHISYGSAEYDWSLYLLLVLCSLFCRNF